MARYSEAAGDMLAREERMLAALNAAHVGTWAWDIRTGEVEWSENLERIHALPPGSFDGTFEGFLGGVHPDDRPAVLRAIQQSIDEGKDYHVEYRSFREDVADVWLEARGRVTFGENGEAQWMLGLCMDITERKLLHQQLRHTQRLESLGLLAGGIAHDFNNLLTGILGNASLALDRMPPADGARPMLQGVVHASQRAAELTRQLLAYAGKGRFVIEDVDISAVVQEVIPLVRSSIPDSVQLRLELSPAPVRGDASQIRQLVMNLVINAAEAIGPGNFGTVVLSTGVHDFPEAATQPVAAGTYACLEVRDTGCGMSDDTIARIFDPFFSTKFAGRGLGLAAALGIVKGHHGDISVRSRLGTGHDVHSAAACERSCAAACGMPRSCYGTCRLGNDSGGRR